MIQLPVDDLRHGAVRGRPLLPVAGAFLRVATAHAISYPMSFLMTEVTAFAPILIYFFVARLVGSAGAIVGGDFFTFAVIGVAVSHALNGALQGFGTELDNAVRQGRFEALLVEPVPWRALPLGLSEWPILLRSSTAGLAVLCAIPLGADLRLGGVLPAIGLLALGLLSALSIGIVAGSVKVLSKESDPVLAIYQVAASVLAGAFFPTSLLPSPLRAISWLIPHTYVIQATRRVLMPKGASLPGISAENAFVFLFAFALILLPVALWLFGRSLEIGRRYGLLGGY